MKLEKLFRTAVQYNASDLYLSVGLKPTLRLNGELVPINAHPALTKEILEEYLLETMTEKQKKEFEESLDLDYAIDIPEVARFRTNVFLQSKGLSAVFRVIPTAIKSLEDLRLPAAIKKATQFKNGLFLLTGPTGCGKSSTMAGIINEINKNYAKHIITVEDPIEFIYQNQKSLIQQREVGRDTKSFEKALRAALRESCDVILVGEMRDLETISLALTAAETGHLVIGTLHTSGAAKAVDRIIDVFPPGQQNQIRTQLADTLRGVIWQNLLKTKDGKGRVAATEIMFVNNAISNMIRKGNTHQINSVIETGIQDGMQTMKACLQQLVQQGTIDEKLALQYLPKEINE